jgi:hypothetical protein
VIDFQPAGESGGGILYLSLIVRKFNFAILPCSRPDLRDAAARNIPASYPGRPLHRFAGAKGRPIDGLLDAV